MISPVDLRTMKLAGLSKDPRELAVWQMMRVRTLIPYLRNNSLFYAKRLENIDETRIDTPSDLERIPFTFPGEVASDPESFLCVPSRGIHRIATINTSGSTGDPKRIFFTANDLERTLDFFSAGMMSMTGPKKRTAVILSSETPGSIASLLRASLVRIGAEGLIHGHIFDPDGVAKAAEAAKGAHCIVGLPSELIRICRSYPELRPESVLLTADYVPEAVTRDMESTWRCKTFSHYGMTETGYGCAVQCERGEAHHVRHADILVEIVDPQSGKPIPPGEEGEVLLTTFSHEAMPLLRYRTGDISSLVRAPCSCGGTLPRLGRVKGRIGDVVDLGGGAAIAPGGLDEIVYRSAGIYGYRAKILTGPAKKGKTILSITIDAEDGSCRQMLESLLRDRLPREIAIDVSCRALPPSEGAKKRRIETAPA